MRYKLKIMLFSLLFSSAFISCGNQNSSSPISSSVESISSSSENTSTSASASSVSTPSTYNVEGSVKDNHNNGLADCTVEIQTMEKVRLQTTRTDIDGTFRFTDLSSGNYIVAVLSVPSSEYQGPSSDLAFTLEGEEKTYILDPIVFNETSGSTSWGNLS